MCTKRGEERSLIKNTLLEKESQAGTISSEN
jgi:hypothetical protein